MNTAVRRGLCTLALILTIPVIVLMACSEPDAEPDPDADNWNTACETDGQCIGKSICACGLCSKSCNETQECTFREGAVCVPLENNAVAVQCGSNPPMEAPGLCMRECDGEADCLEGKTCISGSCLIFDPPEASYCASTRTRENVKVDFERIMYERVNGARRQGGIDCGLAGIFDKAVALRLDSRLECAARLHADDMAEQVYLDVTSPDGVTIESRVMEAGYSATGVGAAVAVGDDPGAVLARFLGTSRDCVEVMEPQYVDVGIGFNDGRWSVVFAWGDSVLDQMEEE